MLRAQIEIAITRYLQPSIGECERVGLSHPLSLAVVYDSMTHGSWERLRDHVLRGTVRSIEAASAALTIEQRFIINYVTVRDQWLASVERLAVTRYRTRFFLKQIRAANWDLKLPLNVRGIRITADLISEFEQYLRAPETRVDLPTAESHRIDDPTDKEQPSDNPSPHPQQPLNETQSPAETQAAAAVAASALDQVESVVNAAAARYDQVDRIATTVTTRNDAAKSLWTTIVGSVSQTFWAIFGLVVGVPREVWLVVAIIASALTLMYLYRQITLGRLRDRRELRL
jgi:hypothetical protein